MKREAPHDWSYSLGGRSHSRGWFKHDEYEDGNVSTPHGLVDVYVQGRDRAQQRPLEPCTVFHFVHKGRAHNRSIRGKAYTRRACVTLAARFAAQVAEDSKGLS